jgi:carbohydrate kinase (thermoresistant glucokinase family)
MPTQPQSDGYVIIVMGVSGAGKTTVGQALAKELGRTFYEGDDFHPPRNIEKMAAGQPLTDKDRAPWLATLRQLIDDCLTRGERAVIACSALRHQYRKLLTPEGPRGESVTFVFLDVPVDVLRARLRERKGHFMTDALLDSQLATLEPPRSAIRVDGTRPVDEIVREVRRRLGAP